MNAAPNLTPIQAFFDLAKQGENRWWSWLGGFWFAMVIFIVGQIVITFLLFGFMAALAPDLILDAQSTSEQSDPVKAIIGLLLGFVGFVATALPIALWLMRGSIKSKGARTIAIGLSALVMIATSLGLIAALQMSGGDNADFGGKVIAAHPVLYALVLLTFPPLALGFWMTVKFVHGRSILSLHTAAKKFRWKRMFFAMLVVWVIAGALSFIGHITGISKMAFVFDPSRFWMYLPVTLLLIPLQSATEEIRSARLSQSRAWPIYQKSVDCVRYYERRFRGPAFG